MSTAPPVIEAPVTVVPPEPSAPAIQSEQPRSPKTTLQEDLVTAGQRHINVMWESTQRAIAVFATAATVSVCSYLALFKNSDIAIPALLVLSSTFTQIISTYFQRTNHTKIGGVGSDTVGR